MSIIQESNTFSPTMSTMDDFRRFQLALGEEIRDSKAETELTGFMEATGGEEVEIVPIVSALAVSSGIIRAEAWEELKQLLISCLNRAGPGDGAYLALHGAMAAEGCDDAGGALVEEVRTRLGPEKPIVVSLDLHANVTYKIVEGVQGIIGYRTFPHTDHHDTGIRAGKLFLSILNKGVRPVIAFRKIPMIVPAENSQTSHGPFFDLWTEARAGESRGDSLYTSLFPVQPWLDLPDMGSSVVVVGEDADIVSKEADRMADLFWDKRHEFQIELHAVRDIVARALVERTAGRPFIISDSADSPGAGSTGDSNYVLKELLDLGVQDRLVCLLTMVDAPAVAYAIDAGVGSMIEVDVGYTSSKNTQQGVPIRVLGRVRTIGDGKFQFGGGSLKGTTGNMGRCVVLQIGSISLLLSEWPTFSGDPAMYRSVGLEPSEADLLLVKSANQFRADYERISPHIFILDTPGSSPANIRSLIYRRLPRPFYPFEDEFEWRGESRL
nr:M81 family metallopeptidase [Cohnella hashimotonis]